MAGAVDCLASSVDGDEEATEVTCGGFPLELAPSEGLPDAEKAGFRPAEE